MSTNTKSREAAVPDAAARRLSNQIARAYRGTYGAHAGLRTLVRIVSVQMLRGGSSPEAIVRALCDVVLRCPAPALVDPSIAMNDAGRASALVARTAEYVSAVAVEMIRRSATIAAAPRDAALPHS